MGERGGESKSRDRPELNPETKEFGAKSRAQRHWVLTVNESRPSGASDPSCSFDRPTYDNEFLMQDVDMRLSKYANGERRKESECGCESASEYSWEAEGYQRVERVPTAGIHCVSREYGLARIMP